MKMTQILAVAVLAIAMVAVPTQAQTRKDKKAAQKEMWEQQQRQQQEEAALLHQIKMDSIRNAQKAQAEAAKQAELDAQKAREKAEAEQIAAEKAAKKVRKTVNRLCSGAQYRSDEYKLRATANREGLDMDAAQQAALSSARQNMAQSIESTVQSLTSDYLKTLGKTKSLDQERKLEQLVMNSVNRQINMAQIICEEYESYYNDDNMEVYSCYITIEIDKESALSATFNGIQKEDADVIQNDYDKFKEEFNQHVATEPVEE